MLGAAIVIHATLATEEHVPALAAFYREVWDREATPESILTARQEAARNNPVAPGEVPPTALVLEGRRIIGYCGSIPQRLWDGTAEQPAYWVKGLMVLPAYRNGPIGFLVAKELTSHLPRATSLAVSPAARRLLSALGYTDLGVVANFVRPLRPGALARRADFAALGLGGVPPWLAVGVRIVQRVGLGTLAGLAAGVAVDVTAQATRLAARRLAIVGAADAPPPSELDDLWCRVRSRIAASPVRDGLYLRVRFGPNGARREGNGYEFVRACDAARLIGVAVVRRPRAESDPRLRGIRMATLSDIVFPPERSDAGLALLGGVERAARAAGSDAILCTTSHDALARLLRRQGYFRVPGNMHFLFRDATGARWPRELTSWWLARGDGQADEVF